jgi:hypothetical protein
MFTALALMVASGAVYAAPLASNFYREAMPQSWRGSWCETAPEAFTRCAHEHSDITITAAGFYDHETNCEHVQIIAPVRRQRRMAQHQMDVPHIRGSQQTAVDGHVGGVPQRWPALCEKQSDGARGPAVPVGTTADAFSVSFPAG